MEINRIGRVEQLERGGIRGEIRDGCLSRNKGYFSDRRRKNVKCMDGLENLKENRG